MIYFNHFLWKLTEISIFLLFQLKDTVNSLQITRKAVPVNLPVTDGSRHGYFPEILPLADIRNMNFHLGKGQSARASLMA